MRRSPVDLLEEVRDLLLYQLSFLDYLLRTFLAFLDRFYDWVAGPDAKYLIREAVELLHVSCF